MWWQYFTQSTMCPFPLKIAVKNIIKEKLPKRWLLYFTTELSLQQECIRGESDMIESYSCSLQQILLIFIVIFFSVFQKAWSRGYRKSIVLLRIRIYKEKDLGKTILFITSIFCRVKATCIGKFTVVHIRSPFTAEHSPFCSYSTPFKKKISVVISNRKFQKMYSL